MIDTHRRGFLSRLSRPVQTLNKQPEQTKREAPRPPSAVDEALFVRLCDGCGECQRACPNSVIEVKGGLAKLNIDYNECTLCGMCTKACSSGALHPTVSMNINLRPSFSAVCNNYQSIDCMQCQLGCPKLAISVEDGELPSVDEDLCNGCGQCQKGCFMGAISMKFIAEVAHIKHS